MLLCQHNDYETSLVASRIMVHWQPDQLMSHPQLVQLLYSPRQHLSETTPKFRHGALRDCCSIEAQERHHDCHFVLVGRSTASALTIMH